MFQVTVLLGQNGAGKSTTFSMITGLVAPTSGSIYICGRKREEHFIDQCQREIGYCPQYNALFNLLTVREHLELFRRLKGNTDDESVNTMISDVLLDNAADMVYILPCFFFFFHFSFIVGILAKHALPSY